MKNRHLISQKLNSKKPIFYHIKKVKKISFTTNLKEQCNLIFYGPSGVGKYTQSLNFIKRFSPTNLRFERKINIRSSNKKIDYEFIVLDEIQDMTKAHYKYLMKFIKDMNIKISKIDSKVLSLDKKIDLLPTESK